MCEGTEVYDPNIGVLGLQSILEKRQDTVDKEERAYMAEDVRMVPNSSE
jgi:hypothetical protein